MKSHFTSLCLNLCKNNYQYSVGNKSCNEFAAYILFEQCSFGVNCVLFQMLCQVYEHCIWYCHIWRWSAYSKNSSDWQTINELRKQECRNINKTVGFGIMDGKNKVRWPDRVGWWLWTQWGIITGPPILYNAKMAKLCYFFSINVPTTKRGSYCLYCVMSDSLGRSQSARHWYGNQAVAHASSCVC